MFPELLDQIPSDREIASVTADGASDTRKGHDAIAGRGADAVIPTRKNAKPWKPDTVGARARNDIPRELAVRFTDEKCYFVVNRHGKLTLDRPAILALTQF